MNLKPLSLNQNSKSTPSNENIEVSIKPLSEDGCPALYIVDASKSTKFTVNIFRNIYVRTQDHSAKSGQSTDTFSSSMGRINTYNDSNAILTRDLLIYGFLCEAYSKAGFQHEMIEQHLDSITKFIKEALCFYGYRTHDIEFNLPNLLPFIQIKKEEPDYESKVLRKFILPGERTSK